MVNKTHIAAGGTVTALAIGTGVGTVTLNKSKGDLADVEVSKDDSTTTIVIGDMPSYSVLALETDFSSTYPSGENSTGSFYGWYLTGIYGISADNSSFNNQDWWTWSFNRWKKDISEGKVLSDRFNQRNSITSAYFPKDSSKTGSMNLFCQKIYQEDYRNIKFYVVSDYHYRLGKDLLNYCSPLDKVPTRIENFSTETYESLTWGETYEDELISINDPDNDKFWELRNKEFFGKSSYSDINSAFSTLYSQKDQSDRGNVKETCKKIYSLPYNDSDIEEEVVLRWCSWRGV